jgi:MYXO-CTERM domain-containing protein
MAKARNIDIVTLRDALSEFEITGTTTETTRRTRSPTTETSDDGLAPGQRGTTTATSETTVDDGQSGFGWLAAIVGVGGVAALRRRFGE